MIDFEQYDFNIFEKKKQKKRQKIEKFSVNPLDGDIIIMVEDNLEVLLDYIKRDKELMNFFKYNYPNRVLCHLKLMSLIIEMCFNLQTSFEYVKSNIDRMLVPLKKEEQTDESLVLFCGHRASITRIQRELVNSKTLPKITCDSPSCSYKQCYFNFPFHIINEKTRNRYKMLLRDKFVSKFSSSYSSCLNKDCFEYYSADGFTNTIKCHCGTSFCRKCKDKDHEKDFTCKEFQEVNILMADFKKQKITNKWAYIKDQIYLAENTYRCIYCKIPIIKINGCSNVYCIICKRSFNYGYHYKGGKYLPINRSFEVKKWKYIENNFVWS